jgi:hypothetical protein
MLIPGNSQLHPIRRDDLEMNSLHDTTTLDAGIFSPFTIDLEWGTFGSTSIYWKYEDNVIFVMSQKPSTHSYGM